MRELSAEERWDLAVRAAEALSQVPGSSVYVPAGSVERLRVMAELAGVPVLLHPYRPPPGVGEAVMLECLCTEREHVRIHSQAERPFLPGEREEMLRDRCPQCAKERGACRCESAEVAS